MRRFLFFFAVAYLHIISISLLQAQTSPAQQWDKTFGFTNDDIISSIEQTSDGGYIIGALSSSNVGNDKSQNSRGGLDYWIIKTDANGNKLWDRTYGGSDYEHLRVIHQTTDGGYILGGSSRSMVSGEKSQPNRGGPTTFTLDYWVVKVDSIGTLIWEKTFGGSDNDELYSLQQTADGGYILGGFSKSGFSIDKSAPNRGNADYWIIKLDAAGNKTWDKTVGGTGTDELYSLQQTSDGGYILGGLSYSSSTGDKTQPCYDPFYADYWVVKVDANGVKVWDRTFGGMTIDVLMSVQQTTDGGYILGGFSNSYISPDKSQSYIGVLSGHHDYWVIKLDTNGNKIWDRTFGGSYEEILYSIKQTSDGGYIMAGSSKSGIGHSKSQANNGTIFTTDYWILKIDGNGNKVWDKNLGGSNNDIPYTIQQTTDGGFIVGGQSDSGISPSKSQSSLGTIDAWMVKLAPSCLDLTASMVPTCSNNGTDITLNVSGFYSNPSWTLNYTVNGVNQTATGSSPTFSLVQNATIGTVITLVNISSGICTTSLSESFTVQPVPSAPTVISGSNCGPGQVSLSATGAPSGGRYLLYNSVTGGTPVSSSTTNTILSPFISSTTTFYVSITNNAGCEGPRTPVTASIIPPPIVSAGPNQAICQNAAAIQLTGFSPAGGVWSGSGVNSSGLFNPAGIPSITHTLTYTVTQNGCTASATKTMRVDLAWAVNAGVNQTVFAHSAPFQLTGFSPNGGTWSGPGVTNGGYFTPSSALVGTQTLTYTMSNVNCISTATKQITIIAPPAQPSIAFIAPDTLVSSVTGDSYNWRVNGTVINLSSRKFKAFTSGQYAVQVVNISNGPSLYSTDFNFTRLGTKEALEGGIRLYPNPTHGLINLELNNHQATQVLVYNALGQVVLTKHVGTTNKGDHLQLDLSKEAKGVYTIQILSDNQVITKKVVLQ